MTVEVLHAQKVAHPAPAAEAAPDRRLVESAVRGEPGAFGQLYQRHVDAVFHYVHFRVRDDAAAEDLTQDVFVSALRGIRGLRDGERFRQWLMRIAHNRLANYWRDRPASLPLDEGDADDPMSEGDCRSRSATSGAVEARDALDALDARLACAPVLAAAGRLTELQQEVVALRFVAGLSVAETAEAMDRSVDAVKNLQHHALAALRRHLEVREVVR